MAIKEWHVGKVILLWAWGLVLCMLALQDLKGIPKGNFVHGFMVIGALLAIPITLSVITWKWLSGKEN
jgi:hypothetical protein